MVAKSNDLGNGLSDTNDQLSRIAHAGKLWEAEVMRVEPSAFYHLDSLPSHTIKSIKSGSLAR